MRKKQLTWLAVNKLQALRNVFNPFKFVFPASCRKPHHMCVSQEKVQDFSKVTSCLPQAHASQPLFPLLLLPAGAANLFASLIPQSWDRNAAAADWRWRVHRSVAFIATFNMLIIILFTRNWISLGRHSSSRSLTHSRKSCDARCQPCCNDSRHSCRTQEVRGKNKMQLERKRWKRKILKATQSILYTLTGSMRCKYKESELAKKLKIFPITLQKVLKTKIPLSIYLPYYFKFLEHFLKSSLIY